MSPRGSSVAKRPGAWPWVLGCLGGGCLVLLVGAVVLGLAIGKGCKEIQNLAADQPSVDAYVATPAENAALDAKLSDAKARLAAGTPVPLVLSAAELNLLIARELTKANSPHPLRVRLDIKNDIVCGRLSLPFPRENAPPKYLNGEAELTVRIRNGQLEVFVHDFRITDRKLPTALRALVGSLKGQNLADDFNRNPQHADSRAKLQQVERLEFRDGQLHLELRPAPGTPLPLEAPAPGTPPAAPGSPPANQPQTI